MGNDTHRKAGVPALTLAALGIVYGDIGTSPIYAFKESLASAGGRVEDVYGVVSLLFWALMIVVTIKYLIFVLRADNAGEGGILALFSLLPRSVRRPVGGSGLGFFVLMLMGTALLFGDGLITPAISVLSATEGLAAINPSLAEMSVPLTVTILFALFAVQSKGTASLGRVFGILIIVWFGSIAVFGSMALAQRPEVVEALSPFYALEYIANHGWHTLIIMSSVILAVTGAEALYADLGHFGPRPIRIGWFTVVAPSLVLCYLGQASLAIQHPGEHENLFFRLAPSQGWAMYLVVVATMATIVASQALISGVASLARQAGHLGLFPRMRVVHTSEEHRGQIYLPAINTVLGVGSILLVLNFRTSSALSHAYSFAIAGTMLITTAAFGIVARTRWHWNKASVIAFVASVGVFDLAFFISSMTKVLHGAWVPLLIALGVTYLMWVWRAGQNALGARLHVEQHDWEWLEAGVRSGEVVETEALGIFLSSSSDRVPQAAAAQVKNLQSIPHRMVIATMVTDNVPYSTREAIVQRINDRATQVTMFNGFMEQPDIPELLRKSFLSREDEASATYYLSDRRFVHRVNDGLPDRMEKVFALLHRNSAAASGYFNLPDDRVVTMAVQMDL